MGSSSSPRSGILSGGNWIVDHVKIIDSWPLQDSLVSILSESWGNGGAAYNVLKDLAKLGASFPLEGIGLVGDDLDGERILADCRNHGINAVRILKTNRTPTAYTDVMTVGSTGRRTFFHQRGANAHLDPSHFDFSTTRAKFFHFGYMLLLDRLDELNGARPRACEVLTRASAAGLITSADCVSENADRFQSVVRPVLPEVDIFFTNDFEAERITGVPLRSDLAGAVRRGAVEKAAQALIELGVRQWVVLHFPEAAFALRATGESHWQPSLLVPASSIRGTAGAGDAFASGVLYGLHEEWPMAVALRLGVSAGASCLFDATCSNGVLNTDECLRLGARFGFRPLPD